MKDLGRDLRRQNRCQTGRRNCSASAGLQHVEAGVAEVAGEPSRRGKLADGVPARPSNRVSVRKVVSPLAPYRALSIQRAKTPVINSISRAFFRLSLEFRQPVIMQFGARGDSTTLFGAVRRFGETMMFLLHALALSAPEVSPSCRCATALAASHASGVRRWRMAAALPTR